MNFLFFNLFFFFTGIMNPAAHPVHVSICNLELNDSENTVAVKLFKDDFALALKNNFQLDIPLEKADEKQNSEIIGKYINSCLKIEIENKTALKLEYNGSRINDDAIWINFSAGKNKCNGKLKVSNSLMLDLWDDQTNLLIVSWNGKEKGYQFNRRDVENDIDMNN